MADVSFDDLIPAKDTTAPSKGADISFDDLIPKTSTTPAVEGKGGAAFGMYPKPKMGPGTDATGLGAFAASAIEGAAATPGVLLGARAGAAIMPPVAPVIGPLSKPAGAIVGGLVGGLASSEVISATESFIDKVMGTNISATRQAQQQQYPYQSLAGQVAGGGFNPWMKFGKPDTLTQGLAGAGIMTVIGAGQRMMQGGDPFDPASITADVVLGGLTKPTARGQRLLGHSSAAQSKTPDSPPPGSTPEQQADFLKMVEIKAKAPLVETAFKNKETGEVTRTGPKHPDNLKADDNLTQGFVDELNVFHTRDEAIAQAKRAGQIPGDHVLENPPNEETGLHSGDLRKTGNKKFEVTAEQPAGVSTAKPEWEQLQEHTKGATNVGQAIDRILAVPDFGNNSQRSLLQAFNSSPFIRDADISFIQEHLIIDGRKAAGSYIGGEGKHEVALAKDGNISTLIHEATHAGTLRLLQEGNHPAAKRLNDLFNEFKNREEPLYEAKLEAFKKEKGDKLTLKELNAFKDQNTHYGLDSVEEFVSEALSNDDFKKFLADTKSKGTSGVISNMLKNIRDAIYDGLGIEQKDRSALDDVLEHTSELLEASKDYTRDSNGKLSISPNKISQMVHDDLEKEGIAVAHTSPHKFDRFDWIKHHLNGEGAMVKSAGTYMSQADKVNEYYVDMAKNKVLDKWLNKPENKQEKFKYDSLQLEVNKKYEAVDDILNEIHYIEAVSEETLGDIAEAEYYANQSFESYLDDFRSYTQENYNDPEVLNRVQQDHARSVSKNKQHLIKLNEKKEADDKIKQIKLDKLQKELNAADVAHDKANNDLKSYVKNSPVKVPTYHSTIEAKPEEILDWDSTKQSDFVKNVFKKLGVDSRSVEDNLKLLSKKQLEILDVTDSNKWSGKFEEDGEINIRIKNPKEDIYSTYKIQVGEASYDLNGNMTINEYLVLHDATAHAETFSSLQEALKSVQQTVYEDLFSQYYKSKTGEDLYRELSRQFEPQGNARGNLTDSEAQLLGDVKASIALAEQGVIGSIHDAAGGRQKQFRNYVVYDDSRIKQNYVTLASRIKESISEPASKALEKVDPRSIPNEEEFFKHAVNIHEAYGPEEAVKFFEDYNKNLKERSIPVPNNNKELDDALHKVNTFEAKDKSEHVVGYKENTDKGVTEEDRAKWFDMRERGEELPPEAKAILDDIDAENIALVRKIKAMGGDVGEEFTTGQSRIRIFGDVASNWKKTIKEFFENKGGFDIKVADQADAAIERKVFQTNDGRVIELHRQPEDVVIPNQKTIKKGTEVFEWKDGKRKLIGRSDNLELKRGDKFEISKLGEAPTSGIGGTSERRTGKFELTIVDGKVPDIEANSPYRYLHDAEASARLANMGLRKMARNLELVENLKKSKLFETVGFSPDKPLKDLPQGWKQPSNIDKIPQLRGWHFDPKTAAIISDFAKVWDNTLWMKLTNQLVKNMMLNPIPHMFNEAMHLWNARGFTGWVDPRQLGTFATTARQAWRDVGNQTQFYRDIMREGGSILGAEPRNDLFDKIIMDAGKNMLKDPELNRSVSLLAKKLGTSVGGLYNGISKASTKAMWYTRDVMYVQYVREIMNRHEKRTGNRMELKDAIAEAERHMPNYRMPSEVLGSRGVAWTLKNPNLSMFSRYHYGMVKSLVNTLKDINPKNLTSPEGRVHFKEGIDSMLAIGVAMGVMYPLMDEIAQELFGEGAEQRRAGPYHLIHASENVIEGKKDATALIWPVFTFNPVLLSLGQLLFNVNIFTKKELYHPDDDIEDILSDIGAYGVKQVPQAGPVMSATAEEGGDTQFIAKQFDIKVKTQKQLEQEERAKAYQKRTKKGRDTKREKGIYKP